MSTAFHHRHRHHNNNGYHLVNSVASILHTAFSLDRFEVGTVIFLLHIRVTDAYLSQQMTEPHFHDFPSSSVHLPFTFLSHLCIPHNVSSILSPLLEASQLPSTQDSLLFSLVASVQPYSFSNIKICLYL